jgi:hypothetical protein
MDCQIFDPITSFDLYELHKLSFDGYNQLHDYFHEWESNLARFIIPQTYNFLEFVHWYVLNYVPSSRSILSRTGLLLFEISDELICEMLKVQKIIDGQVLNEEALAILYKKLNLHDRLDLILSLMENDNIPPKDYDNYEIVIFSPISQ